MIPIRAILPPSDDTLMYKLLWFGCCHELEIDHTPVMSTIGKEFDSSLTTLIIALDGQTS